MPDVTETIAVKASPATLYSLVSDLPRMGEWSPECTKVSWSSGWRTPLRGARPSPPAVASASSPGASGLLGPDAHLAGGARANPAVGAPADPAVGAPTHPAAGPRTHPAAGAPVHPAAGPRTHPAGGAGAHPAVGARFIGHNRSGAVRWFTFGRVVAAEPGRRFAFTIHFGPIPISLWAYEFRATTSGCEVTESWTDHRPKPLRRLFRPIFGNRTPRNAHGIHTTLTRLKSTAESPPLP